MIVILTVLVVVLLLILIGISVCGSLEITSIPYLAVPYTPKDFGCRYEDVHFQSFDGLRLTGWFIPADRPSPVTIIVQHGVGSNAGDMLLNSICLRNGGSWNLFYYNFRGHADSQGSWTSLGPLEERDMESAVAFLRETKTESCRRLGVYGHSLGAAVAIVGASRMPEIEAVALESPFSYIWKTVKHFAWVFYGIPYIPFMPLALLFTSLRLRMPIGTFAPAEAIGKISPRPVYLMHAERDLRIPLSDHEELWAAAKEPKERWVVPGADHGEPWVVAKEEYEKRLVDFFQRRFA